MSAATPREYRILVIEDLPADVVLINHALRKAGFRFRTKRVDSEGQFLHELESHPPDLILSDHGMPGFDGFRALDLARQKVPEIPFLFVSGEESPTAAQEATRRGASAFVQKTRLDRLGPAIERALDRGQESRRCRELEAQLREAHQSREALQARFQAEEENRTEMEEFANRIALDSRTPINQMESLCERLDKGLHDKIDAKYQNYLTAISESARKLARLNDDLITFSRIGHARLYRLRFGLRETVDETIRDLWRECKGRRIEWVIGPLPQVSADPALLLLVMTHLLTNALQFTRPREISRVEIGNRTAEGESVIFVKDNGIGLPDGAVAKVFGAFKRAEVARELEGTGLGLAIVRKIIQRHGGRAWAEAGAETGATFCFSLPTQPASGSH